MAAQPLAQNHRFLIPPTTSHSQNVGGSGSGQSRKHAVTRQPDALLRWVPYRPALRHSVRLGAGSTTCTLCPAGTYSAFQGSSLVPNRNLFRRPSLSRARESWNLSALESASSPACFSDPSCLRCVLPGCSSSRACLECPASSADSGSTLSQDLPASAGLSACDPCPEGSYFSSVGE